MPTTATLVLAVDDDLGILKLTQVSLEGAGFSVLTFDNPRDALDELKQGLRPDVIISDINMPSLDGFNFYQKVREIAELRVVPFLFLTALDDRGSLRKGMTLGADDYLTKPFTNSELVSAIDVRMKRIAELRRPVEGVVQAKGLGSPIVEQNSERLDWDSLKALELLFYLLENRSGVTTYEVAEALWPGKSESKASSSFHTTLYRLRKSMGGELIESANRRYYLHRNFKIDYDVDQYKQLAQRAKETGKLLDYQQVIEIYRGDFMLGFDSTWVEDARMGLHAEHLTLLQTAAEVAVKQKDLEQATRIYQLMTEHEPYGENGWEGLADTWEKRAERGKAEEARKRFKKLMEEDSKDW
jgi:two-component SAPR family response regulator